MSFPIKYIERLKVANDSHQEQLLTMWLHSRSYDLFSSVYGIDFYSMMYPIVVLSCTPLFKFAYIYFRWSKWNANTHSNEGRTTEAWICGAQHWKTRGLVQFKWLPFRVPSVSTRWCAEPSLCVVALNLNIRNHCCTNAARLRPRPSCLTWATGKLKETQTCKLFSLRS